MSTTTKQASPKGVRYTDAQKKEVLDFTMEYNAANGRGGQSKAAEKFNISQLTIASWLKAAGAPASKTATQSAKAAPAPKAAKPAKAAKAPKAKKAKKAKKASSKTKMGSRYTDEQKKEVTDFVVTYNAANGRGGASTASKKFGVSPLTVVAWMKSAGVKSPSKKAARKGAKSATPSKTSKTPKTVESTPVSGGMGAKLNQMLTLSNQISSMESELTALKAKFSSLKASL